MKIIKVLIVDDSALIRTLLRQILEAHDDIQVVGAAANPLIARDMIKQLNPDVLTLDVEMPHMDGLEFLGRLMRLRPMPVIMFSSLTERGSDTTLRALELGAVDFAAKPRHDLAEGIREYGDEIADKIRAAASARLRRPPPLFQPTERHSADVILPFERSGPRSGDALIAIGASTGGTEAIRAVLERMPVDGPAIVVAQHMPAHFTRSFAERLDKLCRISVVEAEDGQRLQPGHAYIAPGHAHLLVHGRGTGYVSELNEGPLVNRHRPAVDVLFRSVANCAGARGVGVLLTGMGKDGAAGLLEMRSAGAHTIAQNEATCVVFGMPHEAIVMGAAEEVLALDDIAGRALALAARAR